MRFDMAAKQLLIFIEQGVEILKSFEMLRDGCTGEMTGFTPFGHSSIIIRFILPF